MTLRGGFLGRMAGAGLLCRLPSGRLTSYLWWHGVEGDDGSVKLQGCSETRLDRDTQQALAGEVMNQWKDVQAMTEGTTDAAACIPLCRSWMCRFSCSKPFFVCIYDVQTFQVASQVCLSGSCREYTNSSMRDRAAVAGTCMRQAALPSVDPTNAGCQFCKPLFLFSFNK